MKVDKYLISLHSQKAVLSSYNIFHLVLFLES